MQHIDGRHAVVEFQSERLVEVLGIMAFDALESLQRTVLVSLEALTQSRLDESKNSDCVTQFNSVTSLKSCQAEVTTSH